MKKIIKNRDKSLIKYTAFSVLLASTLTGCEAFEERNSQSNDLNSNLSSNSDVAQVENKQEENKQAAIQPKREVGTSQDEQDTLAMDVLAMDNVKPVSYSQVNVISRNLFCGTAVSTPLVSHYINNDSARGLLQYSFPNTRQYTDQMILVEGGQRPTGGYGFDLDTRATVVGDTLILKGQWTIPAKDAMVMQTVSSPCVLIEAPAGAYTQIQLLSQYDELLAVTSVGALPAPRLKKSFIDPTAQ